MLKGNDLSRHEKTWNDLKNILQSERSQSEKVTHCMNQTMWHSGKGKTMKKGKKKTKNKQSLDAMGWGKKGMNR